MWGGGVRKHPFSGGGIDYWYTELYTIVVRSKFTKYKTEKNLYDLILVDLLEINRCTYAGVLLLSGRCDLKQVQ